MRRNKKTGENLVAVGKSKLVLKAKVPDLKFEK